MEHPECEIVVWRPVIESDFGQERFFDADPIKVINDGNFTKVPIIIGRTADEFVDVVPSNLIIKLFNADNPIFSVELFDSNAKVSF